MKVLSFGLLAASLSLTTPNADVLIDVIVAVAHGGERSTALWARERFEI